jgi:hypothetical protein
MSISLEHALHNESVCNYLSESDTWNDWVVTTAFYSAVHFVEARIFPYKAGDQVFERFEDYYAAKIDRAKNSHECRKNLVRAKINMAFTAYKWLFENCNSARYVDYRVSPEDAKTAKLKLAVVKSLCVSASNPTQQKSS